MLADAGIQAEQRLRRPGQSSARPCGPSSTPLSPHQHVPRLRAEVQDGAAWPAAARQARVQEDLEVAADRAEGLVGQGDQLGGALRAGEEDQDRCPPRAEEAGQAVRDPGPVRVGQGAGAGVDERVALGCVVPGGPARALGDRDEQQPYAGELLRGIVVRVDPEPASRPATASPGTDRPGRPPSRPGSADRSAPRCPPR